MSTDVLSSDALKVNIGEVERSLDETRSAISSLEEGKLLNLQSLDQLNRYIQEIETSFPKPRGMEIENELYAFEKAREEAKLFVEKQSGKIALLEGQVRGLERELNDFKREQLRSGRKENAFRIAGPEEDEPMVSARTKAHLKLLEIMKKSEEDLENSKDDSASYYERVEKFRKKAEEISREANESKDLTYDKMLARYDAMKSRGLIFLGTPPKKPEGYDQRLKGRLGGNAAGGALGQQPVYVPPNNASEKSNQQQRIDDLKKKIKNTSDPEEKANLEELLKEEMESTQN